MGDRTILERVMELEDLVRGLCDRVIILEVDRERRDRYRKTGEMVKGEKGNWVRKPDA